MTKTVQTERLRHLKKEREKGWTIQFWIFHDFFLSEYAIQDVTRGHVAHVKRLKRAQWSESHNADSHIRYKAIFSAAKQPEDAMLCILVFVNLFSQGRYLIDGYLFYLLCVVQKLTILIFRELK